MATRSIPTPLTLLLSIARRSFVPTPSVDDTSRGSLNPSFIISNKPPKPPILISAPGTFVSLIIGLISSTS